MKRIVTGIVVAALAGAALAAEPSAEDRIRQLEERQASAWNAHDARAYASLFTEDADVVNVLGWHWRTRKELREKLGRAFDSIFARSHLDIVEVEVDFVAPEIAVAHVRWTLDGAKSPTGAASDAPEQGIQTQVLVRRSGAWKIAHFQNTNSIPERPFPPAG